MSQPQKPKNIKKDRTRIVNARVPEKLLEALAMANNNLHKVSLTEIITSGLKAELTQIEETIHIDFLQLVDWEKKIRRLFDNNIDEWSSGGTTSIESGKALGHINPYIIDENLQNVFMVPYLIDNKPLKKSSDYMNKSIDLEGKVAQTACNDLEEFFYLNTPNKENYIRVKGLGKDITFRTIVAQYLKQHSQVLAYDHCNSDFGGNEAFIVRLKKVGEPNFDKVFEVIKQEIYRDVSKYNSFEELLIEKEKQLKMNWKEAFSSHQSNSNDAMFNDISLEIGDWSKYLLVNKINNNVDKELEQFRSQQIIAKKHESTQTLERMKTLLAVNTEVNHRGSLCTELVMRDGTRLYMKTSTFDKNLSVTNKAKSLIGLKVKTSCWNPINKPRKWSNQGYFRNVYELSDFDQLNEAFKSKRNAIIYPPRDNWFKALEYSSFANTKVVILGQDPYHGEGQADGLSFSVPKGMKIPPSLNNIFEELENDDVEFIGPSHGNLASWAKQGVLLLNSALTVEKHSPSSHDNIGWEYITDRVIRTLNDNKENIVFILWGLAANKKIDLIDTSKHKVLSASHPSPFSATKSTKDLTEFFGCKHFSQTNNYLKKNNIETINWSIPK